MSADPAANASAPVPPNAPFGPMCASCGYSLVGVGPTTLCPECGARERHVPTSLTARAREVRRAVVLIPTALSLLLVGRAVEGQLPCLLWAGAPVVAAAVIVWMAVRVPIQSELRKAAAASAIGFAVGVLATMSFVAIAWKLDLGAVATRSSTAGLLWIFAPLWALVVGAAGALAGLIVGSFVAARKA